jgi:hypothetical protein
MAVNINISITVVSIVAGWRIAKLTFTLFGGHTATSWIAATLRRG